jgi:SM-20-related protein
LSAAFDEIDFSLNDEAVGRLVETLATRSYAVADDFVPPLLVRDLAGELARLQSAGEFSVAAIGRETGQRQDAHVRHAAIRWFDGATAPERAFLALADRLRIAINRRLFLGLFEFECNFIAYPVGGFYGRHLDSLTGRKNRVVSLVAYLDADWQESDGGQLRVWLSPEDYGPAVLTIVPAAGRIVLMLSEEIPHEVLPALRPRHAIAGWWRVSGT